VDFIRKLRENPRELEILGSGKQKKSYLEVKDCVQAMQYCVLHSGEQINVFNIGSEDSVDVTKIADIVALQMGLTDVRYRYTGSVDGRGWKGDVKVMQLCIEKIKKLGWTPRDGSGRAIEMAVKALLDVKNQVK
jgi:UDP-glucose 4-epimerase